MSKKEVWDDGTWFEGYVERDDRPLPPGITVPVGAGIYNEVELPGGTVHRLATPVVMSSSGSIFIPLSPVMSERDDKGRA